MSPEVRGSLSGFIPRNFGGQTESEGQASIMMDLPIALNTQKERLASEKHDTARCVDCFIIFLRRYAIAIERPLNLDGTSPGRDNALEAP
jgi:hypothetical protein